MTVIASAPNAPTLALERLRQRVTRVFGDDAGALAALSPTISRLEDALGSSGPERAERVRLACDELDELLEAVFTGHDAWQRDRQAEDT
jgi:hypothetical protein